MRSGSSRATPMGGGARAPKTTSCCVSTWLRRHERSRPPHARTERYGEIVSSQPRCPHCRHFVYLDTLTCPNCEADLGYDIVTREFHGVRHGQVEIDGMIWYTCSNREWACNWLVREDAPAGRCFSCRLTR